MNEVVFAFRIMVWKAIKIQILIKRDYYDIFVLINFICFLIIIVASFIRIKDVIIERSYREFRIIKLKRRELQRVKSVKIASLSPERTRFSRIISIPTSIYEYLHENITNRVRRFPTKCQK